MSRVLLVHMQINGLQNYFNHNKHYYCIVIDSDGYVMVKCHFMYQVLANHLLPTAEKFIFMFIDLLFQFHYCQCSVYLLRICSNALKNLSSLLHSYIPVVKCVCVCVCYSSSLSWCESFCKRPQLPSSFPTLYGVLYPTQVLP